MTYITAFPDFDYEISKYRIDGFVDASTRGDACPCMRNEHFTIWYDYRNPDRRAIKGAKRFTLAENSSLEIIIETNDFREIRKWAVNRKCSAGQE